MFGMTRNGTLIVMCATISSTACELALDCFMSQ